jgi:hypothetical protein
MVQVRHLILALALGTSVGCSSDSDKDPSSQTTEESVTVSITAADGGEVKLGKATLSIPAGALAEDLDVTLETKKPASSLPDQDTLKGMTYDFGPDGTTFEKPVELTLPLSATPGDGEKAVISWYDEASKSWKDLTATVDGSSISAEVEHFTLFIVRFKGVAAGSFDCGFEACGSEGLDGTWNLAGACFDTGKQDNPFADIPGCEDSVFDVGVDAEGEVTFDAGTFDYHWTFTGLLDLDVSAACADALSQGQGCEAFAPDDGVVCVTKGARCACSGPAGDPEEKMGTGMYETSGNTISFTEEGDTDGPDIQEICVKGDEAKLFESKMELDEDTGMQVEKKTTLVLTRK